MKINIPPQSTRRWTGIYPGTFYGTLAQTHNIDLDRIDGSVCLSRRMQRIEDSTELLQLSGEAVHAFIRTNADCTDRYWALTDCGLLRTDSATPEASVVPSADWDTDATASTPAAPLDFTVHMNDSRNDSGRNKLFVTLDSGDIAVLNDTGNNAWTASWWETKHSQAPMDSDVHHPIEFFPFRKITLVGDGHLLHTISRPSDTQNDTLSRARLTFPSYLRARHIFTTPTRSWILCDHKFKGNGQIVEWDGFTQSYNGIHNAHAPATLSGVDYKGVPIVVNSKGVFLEFTGTGFSPMIRRGQRVQFPCAEEQGNHLLEDASDTIGLARIDPRGMAVGEDGLIYINVRDPSTTSPNMQGGIWCLNPETGRLYNKHALGQWGDSTDYGGQRIALPGALYVTPSNSVQRDLLAGGVIYSTATVTQGGIWLVEEPGDTAPTRGYFVTKYMPSSDIKEFWDSLWVKYRAFVSSGNRIVVKAMGTRPLTLSGGLPLQGTITWTAATTFTVTLAAADDALAVGHEVEVIAGGNQGFRAHITQISGAHGALQTITIDETMTTTSGTATARFERWKKLKTITSQTQYEDPVNIGIDSSFLRLKVELRGPEREMELTEIVVSTKPSITSDINK